MSPRDNPKQPPHFQPTPKSSFSLAAPTYVENKKTDRKDPALSHDTPIKVSRAEAKFLRVIFFFREEEEEPSKVTLAGWKNLHGFPWKKKTSADVSLGYVSCVYRSV